MDYPIRVNLGSGIVWYAWALSEFSFFVSLIIAARQLEEARRTKWLWVIPVLLVAFITFVYIESTASPEMPGGILALIAQSQYEAFRFYLYPYSSLIAVAISIPVIVIEFRNRTKSPLAVSAAVLGLISILLALFVFVKIGQFKIPMMEFL